jgi:hypothetical protein
MGMIVMVVAILTFSAANQQQASGISVQRVVVSAEDCEKYKKAHHLTKPNTLQLKLVSCGGKEATSASMLN